jgi:FAD/FMN-containing dehydrogenase
MLSPSDVQSLRSRFHGDLLTPGAPGYDTARLVHNTMIDRRPALIARCATPDDVAAVVTFAREHGQLLSVRCAGHNVVGFAVCDDGVVLDLSRMKDIQVDAPSRTIRVEAGSTWGEINDALQPHGLAATGGFVSVTGVGGLTLGGGLGWLVRKHGLALDNLLSARVVLADGRMVTASASENSDLFWALRGGGGNFGVVTSFEFTVHPEGTVLAGILLHAREDAKPALRFWRDMSRTLPEEITHGALLFHFPEDPAAPRSLHLAPVVGLGGVYAGPLDTGEQVLRPLREHGHPLIDTFGPMPYTAAQRMADPMFPPGHRNYWKSSYFREVSDAALDVIVEFFGRVPSPKTVILLEHNGDGAFDRVPADATAFGDRTWPYNFIVVSAWTDPADDERNIAWTRKLFDALGPHLAPATYVNYLGEQGPAAVRAAYGPAQFARLAALKLKYDPTNLFRMNQNIQPAGAAGA